MGILSGGGLCGRRSSEVGREYKALEAFLRYEYLSGSNFSAFKTPDLQRSANVSLYFCQLRWWWQTYLVGCCRALCVVSDTYLVRYTSTRAYFDAKHIPTFFLELLFPSITISQNTADIIA